ncbi:MAG: hypothetical protein GY765_42385 [bacterium]|nr:hypothetical protein [bacterium]
MKRSLKKKAIILLISIICIYLLLSIPESNLKELKLAERTPFAWNLDNLWDSLEKNFREAREADCATLAPRIDTALLSISQLLDIIEPSPLPPTDPNFDRLEEELFKVAPQIAACAGKLPEYIALVSRLRLLIKRQSAGWVLNAEADRNRLYRLLYGSRSALEEVMLQVPPQRIPNCVHVEDVQSQTPSASILGVKIHSGDILVSRGGAPTSALISRGNNYPGNFSHIALVHVDEKTHEISIIEAHIEVGVAIADPGAYLKDKKLRVMVMRPGPAILAKDPMLPHKAATYALEDARSRHIPYDFAMNYTQPDKLFCSEVASAAYRKFGVNLWMGISHISSQGLVYWLSAFGVKHFKTQEPSDLEYDPQLKVVAEWRDRDTLYDDHLDNAIIDVMLEGAENGDRLTYDWYLLAPARLLKGYSILKNLFGSTGPIPEGMSAAAALKNTSFSKKHAAQKEKLKTKAEQFKSTHGYVPPYWELLKLTRGSIQ